MGITVQLSKAFGRHKKTITISFLQMGKLRHQMVPNTCPAHQRQPEFFLVRYSNVPIAVLSDTWEKLNKIDSLRSVMRLPSICFEKRLGAGMERSLEFLLGH